MTPSLPQSSSLGKYVLPVLSIAKVRDFVYTSPSTVPIVNAEEDLSLPLE
jgi:hypothetical protein